MKTLIALILVLTFIHVAQADLLILTNQETNVKIERVKIGTQCTKWDDSEPGRLCVKEESIYAEVATLSWGEEDEIHNDAE